MKCQHCGKVAHATKDAANRHRHSLAKAGASFPDLVLYQCRGGVWHVGHNPVKFAKRIRKALAAGRSKDSIYRRRAKK